MTSHDISKTIADVSTSYQNVIKHLSVDKIGRVLQKHFQRLLNIICCHTKLVHRYFATYDFVDKY